MIYVDLSQVLSRLDDIILINSISQACSILICFMLVFHTFRIKKGVN